MIKSQGPLVEGNAKFPLGISGEEYANLFSIQVENYYAILFTVSISDVRM